MERKPDCKRERPAAWNVEEALKGPDTCRPPKMEEEALEMNPVMRPRESMENAGLVAFDVEVEMIKRGSVWPARP